MTSTHAERPPRPAPSFIDNPLNIIFVILVPIIAGAIVFILGPELEYAPAILEKIPTPWTAFFGSESTPAIDEMSNGLNVFKKPLALFSTKPMTGFYRDGYCRSGAADYGNHAVAGVVTEEFLDYSASQGNDLRIAGLSEGCKWCLCTSRWLEALDAFKAGKISEKGVPKVEMQATHESALNKVDLDTFKKYAIDSE